MNQTPPSTMRFDVLGTRKPFDIPELATTPCFRNYKEDPDDKFNIDEVVRYVVLLYSRDSVLTTKPMKPLHERRVLAANQAGLNPNDPDVVDQIFHLLSESVLNLIIQYLIEENPLLWRERCILESQIDENHRIRFKPIQNKKTGKVRKKKKDDEGEDDDDVDREDDDKYIVETSNKKHSLTDHFREYYKQLKEYDNEIFGDHENVKMAVRRKRISLESMSNEQGSGR